MAHEFDTGLAEPFASLCREYPGAEVYPPEDFRLEWGPIFHRGRLDGTARVLVIGQDPGAHEAIVRRILVGEAGQRVQGFLAKLGIETSYVMVNAFLYSVYGQRGANRHADDPHIAAYRNRWLDTLLVRSQVEAVVACGRLAAGAFEQWAATPTGQGVAVEFRAITHPTYPESASSAGQRTKAEATAELLANWNEALGRLGPAIRHPDASRPLEPYGTAFLPDELRPIPERDLPPGMPPWMGALESWAHRSAVGLSDTAADDPARVAEAKRATLVVTVPRPHRPWRSSPTARRGRRSSTGQA
jgi:uracil-DNA glycosylase